MKICQIFSARAIWFFDLGELNPRGVRFLDTLIVALTEKYGFRKFPVTEEQCRLEDGLKFESGEFLTESGELVEIGLTITSTLIFADNRVSTDISDAFLSELLDFMRRIFATGDDLPIIRRKRYLSNVSVSFRGRLALLNPGLVEICRFLTNGTKSAESDFPDVRFEPTNLTFGPDPNISDRPANFVIEPRSGTRFGDSTYFSSAPLTTEDHLRLLEKLEDLLEIPDGSSDKPSA